MKFIELLKSNYLGHKAGYIFVWALLGVAALFCVAQMIALRDVNIALIRESAHPYQPDKMDFYNWKQFFVDTAIYPIWVKGFIDNYFLAFFLFALVVNFIVLKLIFRDKQQIGSRLFPFTACSLVPYNVLLLLLWGWLGSMSLCIFDKYSTSIIDAVEFAGYGIFALLCACAIVFIYGVRNFLSSLGEPIAHRCSSRKMKRAFIWLLLAGCILLLIILAVLVKVSIESSLGIM